VPFYYGIKVAVAAVALTCLVGIIFVGIFKAPTMEEAALRADAAGYKEKIYTAYSLRNKAGIFQNLLKKEVLDIIEKYDIRKEIPYKLSLKKMIIPAIVAIVFAISIVVDSPARITAENEHDIKLKAEEFSKVMEDAITEIDNSPDIDGKTSDEISGQIDQIEDILEELKDVKDYEELKKLEDRALMKLEAAANSENSENTALQESVNQAVATGQSMQQEDLEELTQKAEEALEKAENANASEADKNAAAAALSNLASYLGDNSLAEAVENMEDSNYDISSLKSAMEAALSKNSSTQAALGDASSQEEKNADNNGSNGSSGSSSDGNAAGNSSGSGSTGNSSNQGNTGSGSASGWNYGSKEQVEGDAGHMEDVTIPTGSYQDNENLTGSANDSDSIVTGKTSTDSAWAGNKVSYGQVSAEYKEKAYEKLEGTNYPSSVQDKVKNYFDGLN
jgi:hypothetical protein